ncbi:MAG: hypothetical protein WC239_00950 [Sphaerochaetaceae bacterium]|jgi:hypothetical protein
MKTINKKMIWAGFMALAGISLLFVSIYRNVESSTFTGFAIGIIVVSIVKLIRFYRISKSPQKLKDYEIMQREERFIYISEKSGHFTLTIMWIGEFLTMFVLILIGKNMIATILAIVAGIQALIYLGTQYYFSKKY